MDILESALKYLKHGFSVIPVTAGDKTPLIAWKEYQERKATEDEVRSWLKQWPDMNIGIVTGRISNIDVVDCDSAEGIATFETYLPDNFYTPMQSTPRGGRHYIFKHVEGVRNNARVLKDIDTRGEGGFICVSPSKNGNGRQYLWLEGFELCNTDIASLPNKYLSLLLNTNTNIYKDSFSLYTGVTDLISGESAQVSTNQHKSFYFVEGRRDEDLFHIANLLIKSKCNIDMVRYVLEILAKTCNPPYPEKDIDIKIKSAIERVNRKEKNIAADFRRWIESAPGQFKVSDYYNESAQVSKEDKHAVIVEASKLCKEGIIERVGVRRGEYRVVDKDIEIIDWKNADEKEYPIDFPLGLSSLVKLYPGNIVVLAGASNVGKTSFLLETIRLNQQHHKVYYFNSEMGASELKIRLNSFPEDMIKHNPWTFTAIERSNNFADVVQPDALNIIDFMEVYDEFYKIGGWIRDIHAKLKAGIAIIAIQKKASTRNNKQQFGRGGELTLEKPRLYLAMDRGRLEIVKAKIWRHHERNPNGMIRRFKLINGCKFMPLNGETWHTEADERYAGFVSEN